MSVLRRARRVATPVGDEQDLFVVECSGCSAFLDNWKPKADTIAFWNTRVDPETDRLTAENAALLEQVERLRTGLEHYADERHWSQLSGRSQADWYIGHGGREAGFKVAQEALALDAGKESGEWRVSDTNIYLELLDNISSLELDSGHTIYRGMTGYQIDVDGEPFNDCQYRSILSAYAAIKREAENNDE